MLGGAAYLGYKHWKGKKKDDDDANVDDDEKIKKDADDAAAFAKGDERAAMEIQKFQLLKLREKRRRNQLASGVEGDDLVALRSQQAQDEKVLNDEIQMQEANIAALMQTKDAQKAALAKEQGVSVDNCQEDEELQQASDLIEAAQHGMSEYYALRTQINANKRKAAELADRKSVV